MSNFMKTARSWLGLGQDPYYDTEYGDPPLDDQWIDDEVDDDVVDVAPARPRAVPQQRRPSSGPVRPVPADRSTDARRPAPSVPFPLIAAPTTRATAVSG